MSSETQADILPLRQLTHLKESRTFTHEEALELISLLVVITSKTKKEINNLQAQIAYFKQRQEKAQELQLRINHAMQSWSEKVRRLGAVPVSLGKVQIPGDHAHFHWEYPEPKLFLN